MLKLRNSSERGFADHGWLKSHHSFSFADYFEPAHMGFSDLRVINEDVVAGGGGFPTHPHRDMEIFTYILSGALEHKDSMGNGAVIRPGDVQVMSAGTGVLHSEFNPSPTEEVHLLQIWIVPEKKGIAPRYDQIHVPETEKRGRLRLLFSQEGGEGALVLHQDARVYAGLFDGNETAELRLAQARCAYVQVARGSISANGERLRQGDAAMLTGEESLRLEQGAGAEVLVFELREPAGAAGRR